MFVYNLIGPINLNKMKALDLMRFYTYIYSWIKCRQGGPFYTMKYFS